MVYDDEKYFYEQYGNAFKLKYPNIEFEVVAGDIYRDLDDAENVDDETAWSKFLDKHNPDVLIINFPRMEKMAQAGKLYNLDAIIAQEKFDLEGYLPGLIDMLRGNGDGSLYGLAPFFTTHVIYYNAELFREHNIELPRNHMSWQEIFELSSRFSGIGSGDERIYGYYERNDSPEGMLFQVAGTSSLRLFDAKGERLMFDTDSWKQVMKQVTDAIRSRAAMIIGGPWFLVEMKNEFMRNKDS